MPSWLLSSSRRSTQLFPGQVDSGLPSLVGGFADDTAGRATITRSESITIDPVLSPQTRPEIGVTMTQLRDPGSSRPSRGGSAC